MEFDWEKSYQEPIKGDCEDIFIPSDKLDRAKYAEFLTDYLSSKKDDSYVMNLNAEWGAGKTFFLQRWYHSIKNEYPSVYIDAWKHDFSDDPLLAVIASITNYLKENTKESTSDKAKTVLNSGWRFTKNVAPELMRGITKKISGIDISNFGDDGNSSIDGLKYDPESTNGVEDFSVFAGKVFQVALADHSEKINEIEVFKLAIKGWLDELIDQADELKLPMFVFIDELDRCRPTYAIELLETVKHLFEIKGIIFIIATDTEQLQHSIKAVYGTEFDSTRYLYRFFNRSYALKKTNLISYVEDRVEKSNFIKDKFKSSLNSQVIMSEEQVVENITVLVQYFDLDLRTVSQWLEQLDAIYSKKEIENKTIWFVVAILLAINLKKKNIYEKLFQIETHSKTNTEFRVDILNSISPNVIESLEFIFTFIPITVNKIKIKESGYKRVNGASLETKRSYSIDDLIVYIINELSIPTDFEDNLKSFFSTDQKILEIAMSYCQYSYKTTKTTYSNLVEMASDLI